MVGWDSKLCLMVGTLDMLGAAPTGKWLCPPAMQPSARANQHW